MLICPDTVDTVIGEEGYSDTAVTDEGDLEKEGDVSISIHALFGSSNLQTLQLRGRIKKQDLPILVDSGSTHNFLDLTLAKRLGLKLIPIKAMNVAVADGFKVSAQFLIKSLKWVTQGVEFIGDFYAMPIGWLSTLGDTMALNSWGYKV